MDDLAKVFLKLFEEILIFIGKSMLKDGSAWGWVWFFVIAFLIGLAFHATLRWIVSLLGYEIGSADDLDGLGCLSLFVCSIAGMIVLILMIDAVYVPS